MLYFFEQFLNGIQLGMLLFLLAAGLTLIFGIMDLVNLAHGSLYMLGAYFAATFAEWTDSFLLGAMFALAATAVTAMALEVIAVRRLYGCSHLDHVLGTFGLLLFFNELVRLIWGPAGMTLSLPPEMLNAVEVLPGLFYPLYRLVIIGVTIKLLYTMVFGLGAALAGFAGLMQAPILTVQIGMGENILIAAFVVVTIGGIGSIRGAFVAALLVGLADTVGRTFVPDLLRTFLSESASSSLGRALSSMMIYLVMAIVLIARPEGLFPAAGK